MATPTPANESARIESAFEDVAKLAARACGVPIALIVLSQEDRYQLESQVGLGELEASINQSFFARASQSEKIHEIPDTSQDATFQDSPVFEKNPTASQIRFYAGMPLISPTGRHLGVLCVLDHVSKTLTEDQREDLTRLGTLLASRMELLQTAREQDQLMAFQQAILDNAATAIIAATTEGIITHFNPEAEKMLGYSADEMVGKQTPGTFHDPEEIAAVAEELTHTLGRKIEPGFDVFVTNARSGIPETREWTYVRKDGSRLPVLLSVSALLDGHGGVSGFLGMAQDLTEKKLAEEILKESEARLSFLNDLGEAIRPLTEPNKILAKVVKRLGKRLKASRCLYAEFDDDKNTFTVLREYTSDCGPHMGTCRLSDFDDRTARALRQGQTLVVCDTEADYSSQEDREMFDRLGAKSLICNPIVDPTGLRAVMAVHQTTFRQWTPAEVQIVQHVTERCRAAIERSRAQISLRESERFTRASLDALSSQIAVLNGDGCIVTTNRAWRDFEGERCLPWHTVTEGANYLQACDQAAGTGNPEAAEMAKIIRKVISGEQETARTEIACHGCDEVCWYLCRASRFPGDGPVRVVLSLEDITAIKQAQQQAERNEKQFHELFEFAPDAIIMANAQGFITRINRQAESMFGYHRSELNGQPVEILLPESIRENHVGLREEYLASVVPLAIGAGRSNLKGRKKDGTIFPVEISLSPLDSDDGKWVVASVRDISERVRSEQQMRQALATLDATVDGAYVTDAETMKFTYVNQGAVRQLGYSREELLSFTPADIDPTADEAKLQALIEPILSGEKEVIHFTTRHRHKDGHEIPMEISMQRAEQDEGRPSFICVTRDITERLIHEKQERRNQRIESIGMLAGGVAHDLNNALSPILMICDLMRMKYPDEKVMIDTIETSAQRGADMVRQLLTFAKGADGERVSLQARHLVRDLEKLMSSTFPKNIKVEVRCAPSLPTIMGDATQLHQILLNLCVNARDAMPQGGTLTLEAFETEIDAAFVRSHPYAKPGDFLALRVRDTGMGIEPEILDLIFDPFFTTKGPERGTGMGLSTVMGIIKGHGGFVQVYSQPGEGSTFTVYLPAAETDAKGEKTSPLKHTPFRGQGELILLVDDEPIVRDTAQIVLEFLNFTPLLAADAAEGLALIAEKGTALRAIITDMHMPHMDGLGFVRTLRRHLPDVPVLVTSGRLDENVAEQFASLGVTKRLDKPFTQAQFARSMQDLLTPAS